MCPTVGSALWPPRTLSSEPASGIGTGGRRRGRVEGVSELCRDCSAVRPWGHLLSPPEGLGLSRSSQAPQLEPAWAAAPDPGSWGTKGLSYSWVGPDTPLLPSTCPCTPPPLCSPGTSGLSGASAGSRWPEDSACGTAGNAAHGAGGCCWVGRGLYTATAVPSPALRCTCGRRTRGSRGNLHTPEQHFLSRDQHRHPAMATRTKQCYSVWPCTHASSASHQSTGTQGSCARMKARRYPALCLDHLRLHPQRHTPSGG